jgi:ferredoxin
MAAPAWEIALAVELNHVTLLDRDTAEVLAVAPMAPGDRVYDAFDRAGLRLPTRCAGSAICGLCRVWVQGGTPEPREVAPDEAELLARVAPDDRGLRLACRIRHGSGELVVAIRGRRWPHGG